MSLRVKLLLAFFIPALMVMIAGAWSSSRIRALGRQVGEMLHENERSIRYAVRMNEAIERMDSGVLLRMHGDEEAFQRIYGAASAEFKEALRLAKGNITIEGEGGLLDTIEALSSGFFERLEAMSDTSGFDYYSSYISPVFGQTQLAISNLRLLNTEAMYATTHRIVDLARRAALPGDLIIFAAIAFALLFAWLIQIYVVQPLKVLHRAVENWERSGHLTPMNIKTGDEIEGIANHLNTITERSSKERHG